jgi:hypothetical protein
MKLKHLQTKFYTMLTNSDEKIAPKSINSYRAEIENFTVSELAKETSKTERYIKTYLTRNGISCKDYDGKTRKSEAEKRQKIEPDSRVSLNSIAVDGEKTGYEIFYSNKAESDSLFQTVSIFYGLLWLILSWWGFSSNGAGFFLIWIIMSVGILMANLMTWSSFSDNAEKESLKKLSPEELSNYKETKAAITKVQSEAVARYSAISQYGIEKPSLICPHCQTKGKVRSKASEEITSTKVIPIIGNNIKARKNVTQMHCDNCETTWNV